jgi:hypothetical protein
MAVEIWLIALLVAVLLMGELVRISRNSARNGSPGGRSRKSGGRAVRKRSIPGANYKLAPREPDVMAGALFDLLAEVLSHQQMTKFAGIVTSSEMTERYISLLAAREATRQVAKKLAFYNEAMDLNGYTDAERARVSSVLTRRADKQYKLLAIHKNFDKIL